MKALKVVIIFFLCGQLALSQNRIVTGRVIDAASGEPIPFASVFIKGSQYGTGTDEAGNYRLDVPKGLDTIGAYSIGYRQMLATLSKAATQTVNFSLPGDGVQLTDLVIRASKESLEDYLWRNIQENKIKLLIAAAI